MRVHDPDSGETFEVGELLAYQGKKGCQDPRCRRKIGDPDCLGYHCPRCDEPCSMMGHQQCPEVVS